MLPVSNTARSIQDFSKRQVQEQLERSREMRRRKARRRLRVEICEPRYLLASDLTPVPFFEMPSPISINSTPGVFADQPVTVADNVLADFGWANLGNAAPESSYLVEGRLDGGVIFAVSGNIPAGPNPGFGFLFDDVSLGTLSQGIHTISFEVDVANSVAEDNENNNFFSRTFEVTAVGTQDYGDAPTAAQSGFANDYPTTLAQNGARHTPLAGFHLGALIDVEADGQPDAGAALDDSINTDDEDGADIATSFAIGAAASADVFVTNTAGVAAPYLDAWIDYNQNGTWDDAGELVFSGSVVAGTNTINFVIPGNAIAGVTYARLRLHDGATGLAPTGEADDGEVEDYLITISTPGVWIDQGPAPTINGQLEAGTQPNRQVTGAIHTVVAHPTNGDIAYIGGVNGGIWKTENFTAVNPDWVPQTDFLETLSIGALELDYSDATFETLVAGTARYSSFAGFGGERGPVFRTIDGGNTWTQLASNGLRLAGENISGIAARGNNIVVSSSGNFGGIYRSTDGGANFNPNQRPPISIRTMTSATWHWTSVARRATRITNASTLPALVSDRDPQESIALTTSA